MSGESCSKEVEVLRRRLRRRLERAVDELVGEGVPRTIEEVEERALRLRQKAGQLATEELARASQERAEAEGEAGSDTQKLRCCCGRWARYRGDRERDVVTMAGRARLRRRYYYCRLCDAGLCPADRVMGLQEGPFTRRVVQEAVRLDALLPFGRAVGLLWELAGVSVSAKEAQRLLDHARGVVESYQQARWQAAVERMWRREASASSGAPEVLYLLADGVQTPLLGGWKETKVGVVRGTDAAGKEQGHARYVSCLGDAEEFGQQWADLAEAEGVAHARRVVVLADGAHWIWRQAALHFPDALQVLDVWHAVQRLWEVGRVAFGPDEAGLQCWVRAREKELWAYQTDALVAGLKELAAGCEVVREKAEGAITYYENNRSRMDYPRYQRMGLQVGSGPAESACKQIVSQRIKGAGMRWLKEGAQIVARLRCLLLGDEWAAFIRHWNQTDITPAF